jgi:hypothetical protein
MRINCEFDSNEIEESDLQVEQHYDPRIATFLRMLPDSSAKDENAFDSICINREFVSNEIHKSDVQDSKHFE